MVTMFERYHVVSLKEIFVRVDIALLSIANHTKLGISHLISTLLDPFSLVQSLNHT